jgi:RiboL-PSP-HEPN
MILLCAHLEGYLEDLVAEAIDTLVGRAKIENLPLVFRALHAEEHLREIELIRDRNARAPKIEHMFKDESSLWSAGQVVQATMVRPQAVCAELSNPSSREVKQFLKLLGVDIEQHLANVGQPALLGKINGLVGLRNSIAHGEVSASATAADVDQYLNVVEELCRQVDEAVGLAIMGICNLTSLPW